ncbi:MAG: putative beta-lysine N-acetyltransferase [Bacillota bacterium]
MIQEERLGLLERVEAASDDWRATVEVDTLNRRLKLKRYRYEGRSGLAALGEYLISLARRQGLGKILAESREADWERFLGRGFALEGIIPGYFAGENAYFLSYFIDPERQQSTRLEAENEILEGVLGAELTEPELAGRFALMRPTEADIPEMAELFALTFDTYPTPLHQPDYIRKLMETEEAVFRLVRDESGRLVSAAAAEVDWEQRHAEMTNCATLPECRGEGLMHAILLDLEQEMLQREVPCLFSLARASSFGMNLVLRRLGYRYRGRMINNCHICGDWEDMNVWVKL